MTPKEAWSGRKPYVNHFKKFGCIAFAHVPDQKRKKPDDKAKKYVFIGVSETSKAYKLFNPSTKKIVISKDVVFDEENTWDWNRQQPTQIVKETKPTEQSNRELAVQQRGRKVETFSDSGMWESILLTVAATAGNNIGKILQKKGTIILPPLSFKLKACHKVLCFKQNLGGRFSNRYIWGIIDAKGIVSGSISGCGLAILSIFSHFYLKEVMNAVDWVGITLAGFGTIGVGAGGEEQEVVALSIFHIPGLAFIVFILFVGILLVALLEDYWLQYLLMILLSGWLRICKRQRREQEMMEYDVVEEVIYGFESGILFGMSSVISKMGFLFLEQGFPKLLVPMCIMISVCCSGTGIYYQTRGLKHGRAIVVSTCAAVASILTGVLAGMLALGERLPSEPKARLALLLGWLLIIVGVILLVGSTRLVRFLSCSSRQKRSNVEKNFGLRGASSSRVREPSPSAVIQAATLNHLLSSSSKEKA
ncbi:putative magnesium transporter NIPA9 isoform A [Glycine soja]|uniref:Probable magnesium transporter n=1 Tax=Glycine soja TaxID=3848 RepID=A0A445GAE2_GLYSO|nr:putative magnesium transporter NIPA9 isoform A [Glycine soja]